MAQKVRELTTLPEDASSIPASRGGSIPSVTLVLGIQCLPNLQAHRKLTQYTEDMQDKLPYTYNLKFLII